MKPTSFNIIVDEKRSEILNLCMDVVGDDMEAMMYLKDKKLGGEFLDLMEELNKKIHELGWCKSPDCKQK